MKLFKKRAGIDTELLKTLTILDSTTLEVKEIIDVAEESEQIKEITLVDEKPGYSKAEVKDMLFMRNLRTSYPEMKDMETILTDSCKSHNLVKEDELSDEDKAAEKLKIDALAKAELVAAKALADGALDEEKLAKTRQEEIEEAERKRHAAAQK